MRKAKQKLVEMPLHTLRKRQQEDARKVRQERAKDLRNVKWLKLGELIEEYKHAAINDSLKGGGDPADIPLTEANLNLCTLQLEHHIRKIRLELEGDES